MRITETKTFTHARGLYGFLMEFHFLLGQRRIERQYDDEDYKEDMANLAK
jgi:predicted HTH domain antitoxin